ncbi:MAG: hypothetical protein IJK69_02010 [Oscillospiraceae bacterium]|nr:hypothetical protein [Oscillospiraceae bacterium]
MSSENSEVFTKENLDRYLNELSKEYKRLGGRNVPVEIILIGGAAVIERYGFREMTTDVDAIVPAASIMKDAIRRVGSRFGLPEDWLNADFIMTDSYSSRLHAHSVYYRTFSQVLQVRMITGEYLVAMKLRAGRKYKNDLSDVVGILAEHEQRGTPISYEMIDRAVNALYGGWDRFPEHSVTFIQNILEKRDYAEIYQEIRKSEQAAAGVVLEFEQAHPGGIREEKIEAILEAGSAQGSRKSVLAQLKELKLQQKAESQDAQQRAISEREDR